MRLIRHRPGRDHHGQRAGARRAGTHAHAPEPGPDRHPRRRRYRRVHPARGGGAEGRRHRGHTPGGRRGPRAHDGHRGVDGGSQRANDQGAEDRRRLDRHGHRRRRRGHAQPARSRECCAHVRGRRDGRGQARHRQRQLVPLQRRRLRHVAVVAGGAAAPAGHRRRRRRGYVHVHRGVLG